jgi:hypothetical protein
MKKKLVSLVGIGGALAALPFFAFAQTTCSYTQNLDYVLCRIGALLNAIVPVLIALGVMYFIWGVVSYVIAKEEEAKKAGRDKMIYGIIGLVVIVSIWGLVSILKNTFNLSSSSTDTVQVPCIPIPPNTTC